MLIYVIIAISIIFMLNNIEGFNPSRSLNPEIRCTCNRDINPLLYSTIEFEPHVGHKRFNNRY